MQRRAECRMSGKRQLLVDREDTDSLPFLCFNVRLARQDKSCFRKIHLACERLHFLVSQSARVWENSERITGKRLFRKNIKLHEFVTAGHLWPLLLSDDFSDLSL